MRFLCSGALAVCVLAGLAAADKAADKDPKARPDPKASIVFPEVLRRSEYAFLPLEEFAMDKQLVKEVNSLQTKREQVRFLYRQLPARDAKDKRLNPRQFSAVFLLGLSGAPWVAPALVDRLEFTGDTYLHPVMWAIVPLGELAVEPLVQSLQNDNDLQNNMACLALREIKGDKEPLPFDDDLIRLGAMNNLPIEEKLPRFVDQILKRKDLKLSESAVLCLKLTFLSGSGDEG